MHRDKKPHNRLLVDGIFIRMFSVMLLGLMSTMLSTVIDAVFTGQFLGSRAVAAMGFVGPVIFLSNVVTGLFTAGTNQLCARYMGKADVSKVNQVFSTMSICSMTVCLISSVLIFLRTVSRWEALSLSTLFRI